MLSEKSLETIRRAIRFKYDKHVGRLISIPDRHLHRIVPNKGLPISDILKGFNADTEAELRNYGEELRGEITRILKNLKVSEFTEEDKNSIMTLVEDHCQAELYKKRFDLMLGVIDRAVSGYGIKFERDKYRIDIPKSICDTAAANGTRKIKAKIEDDLNCVVESFKSEARESTHRMSRVSRFLELKPNFMGIGLNLNAVVERIFKRKKNK